MLQTFSQLCGVCRIIFSIFLSFWYWGTPSLCWSFGLLLLKFSILHLPLVGHWISLCPALQPIKLLNAHQRLRQYCTISKLAEGTLYPLMGWKRPTQKWSLGSPPTTGFLLDFTLLIMTFWDLPFSQLLIHLTVHSSNPHFLSLPMRMLAYLWGCYGRRHCQNLCWSQGRKYPLLFPYQPSLSRHYRKLSDWSSMISSGSI